MSVLRRDLLPQSLQDIAEFCGDDVMLKIWENYGGTRFQVPKTATPEHKLVALLGIVNACLFCEQFGGEFLTIAKAEAARRAIRNDMIRKDRQRGDNNATLARRYNLTDRQITDICRAEPPTVLNFDLFD
jgi:Mor family transcriptional regulator